VAEVSLSAIRENLRAFRGLVGRGVKVLGVVKADAYGHGAARVAQALEEAGVDQLGVALVSEGAALREAGVRAPILVMGSAFEDEFADLFRYDLVPTVDDVGPARALDRYVERERPRRGVRNAECRVKDKGASGGRSLRTPHSALRTAACHLKIDTGMNRLGIRGDEAGRQAAELASLGHLRWQAVYTHFACAERAGHPTLGRQLGLFEQALAALRAGGVRPALVHAANSSAAVTLPGARFGMVRPGLALYGVRPCPAAGGLDLRPALALKTRVVRVKAVPRGEGVSYGHTWTAPRDSLIGVLPIGYGDGYPRALSNRGSVRIAGRLCPIVGVVCMDATMVDLTELAQCGMRSAECGIAEAGSGVRGPGSGERPQTTAPIRNPQSAIRNLAGLEATLIEPDNDSPIGAAAVARLAGTIPYEILSVLTARVPRVYV
jgi:alanine racemase